MTTLSAQYKLMGALWQPKDINHAIAANHVHRIIYYTAHGRGGWDMPWERKIMGQTAVFCSEWYRWPANRVLNSFTHKRRDTQTSCNQRAYFFVLDAVSYCDSFHLLSVVFTFRFSRSRQFIPQKVDKSLPDYTASQHRRYIYVICMGHAVA